MRGAASRPVTGGALRDHRTVGLLVLALLGWAGASMARGADSMTVAVVPRSPSGVFRDATVVYLDGPIDPDAPARLSEALEGVDGKILAWLNSPGGNLFAGMQLGRVLRQRGAWTYIINSRTLRPGECYSACGLAFLGGVRRFNDSGRYGVHRASLQAGPGGGRDLTADLSSAIGSYVREMGVDARLLDLWKKAGPDRMYLLSRREAEDLRVVYDGDRRPQ
jgi:hypothetical protein